MPPSAGPLMVATWFAIAPPATAREIISFGTIPGTSVFKVGVSKARQKPIASTVEKMTYTLSVSVKLPTVSTPAHIALPICARRITQRRS